MRTEGKPMTSEPSKNICKYCGCLFHPSPKHPQQECCGSPNCRRAQARIRQRRCAKKRHKDLVRLRQESLRKHREYIRRREKCKPLAPPPPPRPHITLSSVDDYFVGLLKLVTVQNSANDLYGMMERCRLAGRALRL